MERISALMDGELDRDDVARAVQGVKERSELGEAWSTYHLIGDVLRGERGAVPQLLPAIRAKLADEPTVLAPKKKRVESLRRLVLPSLAAAAALTAVTWMSLVTQQGATTTASPVAEVIVPATSAPPSSVVATLIQPTYTSASIPPIQFPSRRIDAYLQAHQEFSPSRTIQGLAAYARTVSTSDGTESRR
jgi:sigma-E factor negative regulatory protein RseA